MKKTVLIAVNFCIYNRVFIDYKGCNAGELPTKKIQFLPEKVCSE